MPAAREPRRYARLLIAFALASTLEPSLSFVGPLGHGGLAPASRPLIAGRAHRVYNRPKSSLLMSDGGPSKPPGGRVTPGGDVPPGIDPKTGLPYGYEMPPPPKLNKAQACFGVGMRARTIMSRYAVRRGGANRYRQPRSDGTGFPHEEEALIKKVIEKSKGSTKMKRVEFKSSASAVAKINDTNVGDNVTLGTYMTLPAEQWVTLDDRYISRLDAPSDDKNAVQYRFTLPLKHFMQLPLTATCDVSVNIDEKSRQLRLEATGAKLRPSTAEDDELPAPNMTQQGGNMTKMAPPTLPPNFTQSIEQADMEVAFKTKVKWQETGSNMFGQDKTAQLDLNTEVQVKMTLPPPLSFLPSFLLKQAGGLVLKAACVTILPRFGELVAEDYRRWSRGEPRVGGSLAPPPSTLQKLEGDPYYFPPPPSVSSSATTQQTKD